jgi:protein phosphatase
MNEPNHKRQKKNSFHWTSRSISHEGRVRKINEDSHLDRSDANLWVVADGMGGHDAGDVASQMIVEYMRKVRFDPVLSTFVNSIEDSLLAVHEKLQNMGAKRDIVAGSTVVVLIAHKRHCLIMWAGDSRIYLFRQGQLTQLTEDHSYVDEMVKRGKIRAEDAETHAQANVITRAVGAGDALYLDVDIIDVRDGDTFLLCSDGLNKEVTDGEISRIMGKNKSVRSAAQELIDSTLSRGARDNVTAAVVRAQG